MSKVKFYNLADEEERKIRDAEARHHETTMIKELSAIREAIMAQNALMLGLMVRI